MMGIRGGRGDDGPCCCSWASLAWLGWHRKTLSMTLPLNPVSLLTTPEPQSRVKILILVSLVHWPSSIDRFERGLMMLMMIPKVQKYLASFYRCLPDLHVHWAHRSTGKHKMVSEIQNCVSSRTTERKSCTSRKVAACGGVGANVQTKKKHTHV